MFMDSRILCESRWFSWPIIFRLAQSVEWPASLAFSDTADLRSQVYVLAISSKRKVVELLNVLESVEGSSDGTNLKIINQSRTFVLLLSIEYSRHNEIKLLEPRFTFYSFLYLKLLEHLLRPLAKIYPMEWRSVLVDFGTPPTEHLFIRVRKQVGKLLNSVGFWLNRLERFLNQSELK